MVMNFSAKQKIRMIRSMVNAHRSENYFNYLQYMKKMNSNLSRNKKIRS